MTPIPDVARVLVDFQPEHQFFVGIDSDGCAFDTMEVKHKECFIPNTIKFFGLQAISKYERAAASCSGRTARHATTTKAAAARCRTAR